jgi:hypothetical protein
MENTMLGTIFLSADLVDPDPIYAAIEHHKAAVAAFSEAVLQQCLEEALPPGKRRSWIAGGAIIEADDPQWIQSERHHAATSNAMDEAAEALLNVEPQTLAGAIALLQHAVEHIDSHKGDPNWLDIETNAGKRSPEYFLMRNAASALKQLHN